MAEPAFAYGELLKLVVALGVTIGLFYALALFMKRLQVGTGKSGSLITVLAALPLGAKEKLWVVDVAGEKLVIGTAPGNVNCLHVLKGDAAGALDGRVASGAFEARDAGPFTGSSEATPSSFPRRRESTGLEQTTDLGVEAGLDSRLPPTLRSGATSRGNDNVVPSDAARGFADLLTRFRGWQK